MQVDIAKEQYNVRPEQLPLDYSGAYAPTDLIRLFIPTTAGSLVNC